MSIATRIDDRAAVLERLQRHDFVSFLIGAFPQIHGGSCMQPNWHHEAIAYQLGRVHAGETRRLLITLPPRGLKSVMISVAWVAWCLGQDPTLRFVCVTYSQELSLKHARDCRTLMQTNWYRRLFPGTIISVRSAVHDFETTRHGGRLATSVAGTLTGRGGDIIIVDDPINPKDANSTTVRDGVNDWYSSTLVSRLNDKTSGAMITVMQRLHQYDPVGMLLESGGWDHLSLPAIAPEDASIPLPRGRAYQRRAGHVLHPAREPLSALLEIKRQQGSDYFAAQYLQDPVPAAGKVVKAEWLRTYDEAPSSGSGRIVQSWDTASKEGALNDYSVGITAHVDRGKVRVLDVFRQKLNFPELKASVIRLARQYEATVLLIEDQASGLQLIQTLRAEAPSRVPHPIARRPESDKLSRMQGVTGQIEAGQLLLPRDAPWLAEFKTELLSFPSGRFDDQVDALTQLMAWVLRDQDDDFSGVLGMPILFGQPDGYDPDYSPSYGSGDL